MENKKIFGVSYKEYNNLIGMINRITASGNTTSAKQYEDKLNELVKEFGVMDPKLSARLNYLRSSKQTDTEEFAELVALEKECYITFYKNLGSQVKDYIKDIIGDGKTLKLNRREKVRTNYNGTKVAQPWNGSQLMSGIRFFEYPVVDYSEEDIQAYLDGERKSIMSSNSTVAVAITTEENEITLEKMVRVRFFSLQYDAVDKKYITHEWLITFDVVSAPTKEQVADADADIETALEDWA